MHYIGNNIILTFFSFVDRPINRRLIEACETSVQLWLNGLAASGALLGATITFAEEDNSLTDLIDGKIRFHIYAGFVLPAESMTFTVEFDPSYCEALFG